MTSEQAISTLRLIYQQISAVQKCEQLDRSQRTMLDIAIGRVTVVGKQLKAGSGTGATVTSSS